MHLAAAALAALSIGIADSDAATFGDPAWAGLHVRLARAVMPWDVALSDPGQPRGAEFDRWVAGAAAGGVRRLGGGGAGRRRAAAGDVRAERGRGPARGAGARRLRRGDARV